MIFEFPLTSLKREIGRFGGTRPGPRVVTIAGLHGNEPAGVAASQRVLSKLRANAPRFAGEYIALAGNIPALAVGRRFIDEDLNRIWLKSRLAGISANHELNSEQEQQRDLLNAIEVVVQSSGSEIYFLDLHSTSAPGAPFSVFADTLRNRKLASSLPCPMVLGLEEHLQGTLLNYINELGFAAVGLEGGQNTAASSVDTHELGIWHTFAATGCLERSELNAFLSPDLQRDFSTLPRIVEIRYRHDIQPEEGFVMEPGFENLKKVSRGNLLARDRHGEIRAMETGFILMPLYQNQGSDGFFIVKKVRPFWFAASVWLRALRLEKLLPLLPGVSRRGPETLVVDSRIARWLVVEIFHLLGFRRQRPEGNFQVFSRRRERPGQSSSKFPAS